MYDRRVEGLLRDSRSVLSADLRRAAACKKRVVSRYSFATSPQGDPKILCGAALVASIVLSGCLPADNQLLSNLTETLAEQTVAYASPSIHAALLVSGLTSELCRKQINWSEDVALNTSPPLSAELLEALGNPIVDEIEPQVLLRGVRIMDRENAYLRFDTTRSDSTYELTAEVVDGREEAPFGSLNFSIGGDCGDSDTVWLAGDAEWTDLDLIRHSIAIPADDAFDLGLKFDCSYLPSIPKGGTLLWSGRVEGQERSFTTKDAAEVTLVSTEGAASTAGKGTSGEDTAAPDDTGASADCSYISGASVALWPGTVQSGDGDWAAEAELEVPLQ